MSLRAWTGVDGRGRGRGCGCGCGVRLRWSCKFVGRGKVASKVGWWRPAFLCGEGLWGGPRWGNAVVGLGREKNPRVCMHLGCGVSPAPASRKPGKEEAEAQGGGEPGTHAAEPAPAPCNVLGMFNISGGSMHVSYLFIIKRSAPNLARGRGVDLYLVLLYARWAHPARVSSRAAMDTLQFTINGPFSRESGGSRVRSSRPLALLSVYHGSRRWFGSVGRARRL